MTVVDQSLTAADTETQVGPGTKTRVKVLIQTLQQDIDIHGHFVRLLSDPRCLDVGERQDALNSIPALRVRQSLVLREGELLQVDRRWCRRQRAELRVLDVEMAREEHNDKPFPAVRGRE